jgi:hypothetical protein
MTTLTREFVLADPANRMALGLGGRFPGEARDLDQALVMLRKAMDADQVWPDVWFISDHGNAQRLDSGGRD